MAMGNVLVIGNSGVGKSTLINAVLGRNCAKTGFGITGTTTDLEIYGDETAPFRVIDTIGFEPTFLKESHAINAVRKWSKAAVKDGDSDRSIDVIWFCVDGTSRKLFPRAIQSLARATSLWNSVPIITVITKSYSVPERPENIEMVGKAFAKHPKLEKRVRRILPVVAATYTLNETAFAAPEGITELIEATNALLPEGIRAAESDVAAYQLGRKRALAHGLVAVATASGATVGAVPLPLADAAILVPVEVAEINAIAKIYGVKQNEISKRFLNSIVEAGTVSAAAHAALSALKAIPSLNVAASVLNAAIAGSFVAALGEAAIYAFDQIYLGNKSLEDIDWVKKLIETKLSQAFIDKATKALQELADGADPKAVAGTVLKLFFNKGK